MIHADHNPFGMRPEAIEDWLQRVGAFQEHGSGMTLYLTTEIMRDYAEWVAAWQREMIAQMLEVMPDDVIANRCGDAVRQMRAEH